MKTITLQTYNLNKEKFNKINKLSIIVRQTKNKVSQYIYNNCLYEVLTGYISSRYLYTIVSHLKPTDMLASTFQLLCSEVYNNYQNAKDNYFKFGKPKDNELDNIIRYITKITSSAESYQELVDKLNKMKDKTYGKNIILPKLNPLLYQYALNKQKQLILKSKPIKFVNKGFDFKNVLTYKQDNLMFQLSYNKYTNAVVILKLDELITLPFRYSQDYHNDLINKEGGVTFRTTKGNKRVPQQRQYQVNIKPLINNEIQISIAIENNNPNYNFKDITNENTLGIDINLKREIMTFDNTESIHKNREQIKKAIKVQKQIAKIQQTKARQGKIKQKYGKKAKQTLEKNTRRNKYYNDLYAVELKGYCIKNKVE